MCDNEIQQNVFTLVISSEGNTMQYGQWQLESSEVLKKYCSAVAQEICKTTNHSTKIAYRTTCNMVLYTSLK